MAPQTRVDRLAEALGRLARAQARTESALRELAEAQRRTEARLEELGRAQAETQAQVRALAEAQARTEARLERVEGRVDRLELALQRLAEAQARTESALQELAQQVGRLSETIGFTLEDLAREVTPAYLAQHYGIQGLVLDRQFFVLDGQEIEVDFYGQGRRDGEPVAVVGEVRSRIYGRDVEALVRQMRRLAPQLPATPLPVLFGFVIHPSAREAAERFGAIVISSSGR